MIETISARQHFRRCSETTRAVWPEIRSSIEEIIQLLGTSDNTHIRNHLNYYVSKRDPELIQEKQEKYHLPSLLRPYLTRCVYETCGGNDWQQIIPAMAGVELHNISTYQTNASFDGKVDWEESQTTPNGQVIAAMLTLGACSKSINRLKCISTEAALQSVSWIQECNTKVYLGQYLDIDVLKISDDNLKLSEDDFLKLYLRRCKFLGGATFSTALIGGLFAGLHIEDQIMKVMLDYLTYLGMGTQITNDLGDYHPKELRPYANRYIDLVKGRLTYPSYLLLKYGVEEALAISTGRQPILYKHFERCTQSLIEDIDIFSKTKSLLDQHVTPKIKGALDELQKLGCNNEIIRPLSFWHPFLYRCKFMRYFSNGEVGGGHGNPRGVLATSGLPPSQ